MTAAGRRSFTSESVTEGHPDEGCHPIGGAVPNALSAFGLGGGARSRP
ncbi:hypothetical protein F0L17_25725 [Streptomyces sp. TRM43335]|uniref:S-adenosylmethionine synthetase N-terminal domain-containing protein n=1 Tax=Streptomyces taklimakanensis TaxID=2569853 RepID=A0A6G2BK38_9ACTN|nr:hypothetical protein [Streptomyces taklimakanensis]